MTNETNAVAGSGGAGGLDLDELAEKIERAVFDAWAVREGDKPTADTSWWHIHRSGPTHTRWAADAVMPVVAALVERARAAERGADESSAELPATWRYGWYDGTRQTNALARAERDRDDALLIADRHRAEADQLRGEVERLTRDLDKLGDAYGQVLHSHRFRTKQRDDLRAELADASSLADTKQAEPETMRWTLAGRMDEPAAKVLAEVAQQIVAWVNANGGEARYEPGWRGWLTHVPRIAVRTATGWDRMAPCDEVVKGERWFDVDAPGPTTGLVYATRSCREFTVRRAADTEQAEPETDARLGSICAACGHHEVSHRSHGLTCGRAEGGVGCWCREFIVRRVADTAQHTSSEED